jgi:predicted ferric reductase
MVEATIGTVLLIAVVVTSLVIVRRRLRYESWYLVHLLAYAGIVLGWFHQIPTGNELVLNPSAAAYWTALYVVTLGLLVVFRILQPAFQALWHGFRVAEVWSEGPNVVSLRIVGRRLNRLNVRGGQFFIWRFLTRDRWWEAHPYSLSAAPDGRSLRITVKDLGDFSRRLSGVRPGTRVLTEGPFGVFTAASRTRERVALIAAGIGITPIRAVLEEMVGDIVLVYRVACDEDIVFRDEIESIARTRGIPIHYVVGNRDAPGCAAYMSTEHLIELVPDLAQREVYLCGPPSMMFDVEDNVRRAGVPGRYIHVERFAF